MPTDIDLSFFFTPQAIEKAYWDYKDSKTGLLETDEVSIPMGADGVTWENFEKQLPILAKNISNRIFTGEYYFYPFRERDIPKPNGEPRRLSIASIRDVLVQRQLYEALYPSSEENFSKGIFDKVSFAYRKGKSAPYAVRSIWAAYQKGYIYALDADIQKFFDNLNHGRLMELVDNWIGRESNAGKLIWRFIRTDRVPYDTYNREKDRKKYFQTQKPKRESRIQGVPQGGVLSGMLANLYLHEFDQWVIEHLGAEYDLRYFRYADDFVILAKQREIVEKLKEPVGKKLSDDILVKMHTDPKKTKISEIPKGELEFVGFQFTEKLICVKQSNIDKFKNRFLEKLQSEQNYTSESYNWEPRLNIAITYCVNPRIIGVEPEICSICGLPLTGKRNWIAFFAQTITDVNQLRRLDRWMRKQVCSYFYNKYRKRLKSSHLRKAGMKNLVNEYFRLRREHSEFCQCDPEETVFVDLVAE